ncbi:MAG: hypothetical protein IPN37_21045 [Betaproteobacteria bacterium]|nr:hypothetical protein [Betaproteobacteria bacterium]
MLFLHGFGGDLDNWLFNLDTGGAAAPVIALTTCQPTASPTCGVPGGAAWPTWRDSCCISSTPSIVRARTHAVNRSMGGAVAAQMALFSWRGLAVLIASAGLGLRDQPRLHRRALSPQRREAES